MPRGQLDEETRRRVSSAGGKASIANRTPEQLSAGGKAGSAVTHSAPSLARRLAAKWPALSEEERSKVRRTLAAAGIQVRPRKRPGEDSAGPLPPTP